MGAYHANRLTRRQQQCLDFVKSALASRGFPPSVTEIGKHMGIRSTNGVVDHLNALERKGYIERQCRLSRGIKLIEDAPVEVTSRDPRFVFLAPKRCQCNQMDRVFFGDRCPRCWTRVR